jgi:hypothetical protein
MSEKNIRNEQWDINQLVCKIKNGEINKPKYQRQKKWDVHLKKEGHPNEQSFIEFLYTTYNSVHAITFGEEVINGKKMFSNIDGNNRINAIKHYMDRPFDIFPDYLDDLFRLLDMEEDTTNNQKIKEIFQNISYKNIISIRNIKSYFKNIGKIEIYSNIKDPKDEIEEAVIKIQDLLQISGKGPFDSYVKINVNLFDGYTTNELCKTFEDINKYNSKLTEDELLASRLYDDNNFVVSDPIIKASIINNIKIMYESKSENEVLKCYEYENETINAYDFIRGFQYYCNITYSGIEPPDNNGLSLFFKLYKTMYTTLDNTFTTENINDFITKIIYSCELLTKTYTQMFTKQINENLFSNSCMNKLSTLKKNNIYLILSSLVGFYEKEQTNNYIINSVEKCVLYHLFMSDLTNKENKEMLKGNDLLTYNAGGGVVDKSCVELVKTPKRISEKISKEKFEELIYALVSENTIIHNSSLHNGKTKHKERRKRKFFEKTLMFYYYKSKVSSELLENNFNIEHICPFSSTWDGELAKDRLGNLIPILESTNKSRGNNHISSYKDNKLHKFLVDIIPNKEIYDTIMNHKTKTPEIINIDNYNKMCDKNEKQYVDNFINCIFP